jgi:hypothetical protein
MNFNNTLLILLEELTILKTTKVKPIVDAIKNRNKISFYYSGPRKGKDSVKSGKRVLVEPVALGVSKKGYLIIRAFVQPPSVTKTGFGKHGWRTFVIGRMTNVEISDQVFNEKRPGYNPNEESPNGPMVKTYVTVDWSKQPKITQPTTSKPAEKPIDTTKPEVKPTQTVVKPIEPEKVVPKPDELPQPKPEVKPTNEPTPQDVDNQDLETKKKELYKTKQSDWVNKQKEIGGNIKPGQGTRERFKKEVDNELPQPKPEEKPTVNPEEDEENKNLQENLRRIKSLMLL